MPPADQTTGPIHIHAPDLSQFPQQPTFLVAFVPGDDPPQRGAVAERLEARGARARPDLLPADEPDDVLWRHVVETDRVNIIELTAMRAAPVEPGAYGDAAIEQCMWVVTASALINPYDPAGSYAALLETLTRAFPDETQLPGVLDVDTSMCHPRAFVDSQLELDDAPPPADWLWRVDVYTTESAQTDPSADDRPTWLRTVGLNRCRRHELEMIVPHRLANAAARTIDLVADALIEDPEAISPQHTIEIGPGLALRAHDVNDALDHIDDSTPGSRDCRQQLDVPDAPAVLLTAVNAGRSAAPLWRCDESVLNAVHAGTQPVYRTERATARQAALARHHWPPFADAFHRARAADPALETNRFLVKAALNANDPADDSREHVWLEVQSIEGDTVRARAVHDAATPDAMARDDRCAVDPAGITDWLVATADGTFGPAHVSLLDELIPASPAHTS